MVTPFSTPFVSVVMPAFNAQQYIAESVASVLSQTYQDLELIIVDDGSTDESTFIIESFHDPRVRILHNGTNCGIVASLNRGISSARGKYIARMDADDLCFPQRIERQALFMEQHPEIGISGTFVKTVGLVPEIWRYPTNHEEVKAKLLFGSSLAHPSVMMRRSIIEKHKLMYRDQYPHAEDYDLWVRYSDVVKFANIPEVLLLYRIHDAQVSQAQTNEQKKSSDDIRGEIIHRLIPNALPEEIALHNRIACLDSDALRERLPEARQWLRRIILMNNMKCMFNRRAVEKLIHEVWFVLCIGIKNHRFRKAWSLLRSPAGSKPDKVLYSVKKLLLNGKHP